MSRSQSKAAFGLSLHGRSVWTDSQGAVLARPSVASRPAPPTVLGVELACHRGVHADSVCLITTNLISDSSSSAWLDWRRPARPGTSALYCTPYHSRTLYQDLLLSSRSVNSFCAGDYIRSLELAELVNESVYIKSCALSRQS